MLFFISFSFLPIFTLVLCVTASNLKDQARNAEEQGLIAAFGDFDSDKLTDVFVIRRGGQAFSLVKQNDPQDEIKVLSRGFTCRCIGSESIVALIPSDFDGDTLMDVVVVLKRVGTHKDDFLLKFVKGFRDSANCSSLLQAEFAVVRTQPLVVDFNGDMISDLLAEDSRHAYRVWLGTTTGVFQEASFPYNQKSNNSSLQAMRKPSSNAYVDLNGDLLTDLSIEGEANITYWLMGQHGYTLSHNISYPEYKVKGLSSFADINGDSIIDHMMPVCNDKKCSIVALKKDLTNPHQSGWETLLESVTVNGNDFQFENVSYGQHAEKVIKLPPALRVGDVNGDGFPDLVSVMYFGKANDRHSAVVVFFNIAGNNSFGRSFDPKVVSNLSMHMEPQVAAFFDLYENGRFDVIYSASNNTENSDPSVFFNLSERENDANFLKVLVTSERCLNNKCYQENMWQKNYKVPYGTNVPGPTVCYHLKNAKGIPMESCAGQLSQSANFALQLPYSLFGLGPDSNYVDKVDLRCPAQSISTKTKLIEQIVPDSQIVVIPHPLSDPDKWVVQLFVTPSEIIYKTFYTFLGICGGLVIIVLFLHRKEQLKDLAELEQYRITWPDRRR